MVWGKEKEAPFVQACVLHISQFLFWDINQALTAGKISGGWTSNNTGSPGYKISSIEKNIIRFRGPAGRTFVNE